MTENNENLCPLCTRELAEPISRHHLIPLSKGGKDTPTVPMHKICQNKIHAVFTETELKNYYFTIDRLLENDEIYGGEYEVSKHQHTKKVRFLHYWRGFEAVLMF